MSALSIGDGGTKPAEVSIDLNAPKVDSFNRESIPKIREFLDRIYAEYRRDPMRIFSTLSIMLGREIYVREDYNAKIPYVVLADGALSLHVLHGMEEPEREEYKAIIRTVIKPELVKLAKELDRAVQHQLLEDARKALKKLDEARKSLRGETFDFIDKRLLAVNEDADIANVGTEIKALLDGVFNQ